MVDAYVNRKHGREKPTLRRTRSWRRSWPRPTASWSTRNRSCAILNRLGGIELASAYACIKAISKKKQDIIDQRQAEFIKGAQERGVSEETAEEIFELIVKFGGYGFNKSHTAAYAQRRLPDRVPEGPLPAEFMAALLSSEIDDGNKRDIMVEHIADARRLGVEVLPPDVNDGEPDFTVAGRQDRLRPDRDQGLGRGAAEEIVARAQREAGRSSDLFDFCERIDRKVVPKAAIETADQGRRVRPLRRPPRRSSWTPCRARCRRPSERAGGPPARPDATCSTPSTADGDGAAAADEALPRRARVAADARSSSTRRRRSTSTSPAIRWPSTRTSCAASPRTPSASSSDLPPSQEVFVGGMLTQVRFMNTKKAPQRQHRATSAASSRTSPAPSSA